MLPIAGPSNFTLTFGGQTYALSTDYARGGVAPTSPTGLSDRRARPDRPAPLRRTSMATSTQEG